MFSLLILSLVFLFITVLMDNSLLGLLASLMLGLFAFMNVPGLQLYVVELAEKYVPEDITLASAFNIAAFNIGITVGSMTGGVVTDHLSVTYTPIFGGFIVLIAVLFVLYIRKQEEQKQLSLEKQLVTMELTSCFLSFCGNNSSKQLKQLLIRLTRKSEK